MPDEFIQNFQKPTLIEIDDKGRRIRLADYDTLVRILYRDRTDIYALKDMIEAVSRAQAGSELSEQGAALPSTVLYTPSETGRFAIRAYSVCRVAGAGTVSFLVAWTDEIKAQSASLLSNLSLAVLGNYVSGQVVVKAVAGMPISFSTTIAGLGGGAQYDLSVGLEAA